MVSLDLPRRLNIVDWRLEMVKAEGCTPSSAWQKRLFLIDNMELKN